MTAGCGVVKAAEGHGRKFGAVLLLGGYACQLRYWAAGGTGAGEPIQRR